MHRYVRRFGLWREIPGIQSGSEPLDPVLQLCRNLLRIGIWRKIDGFANPDGYLVWAGGFLTALFQFEQPVDTKGDYRDSQVVYQQANS
jgi:hypothetical protein